MIRVTLAVLRRELGAYFLSPISYLITALFLVVHGYSFFLLCQVLSTRQASTSAVMQYFFGGTFLYWLFVMFVAAVLTMRLVAEERQRGTLEPLLTAPVQEGAVIAGKYLAALSFYLFLWAPTLAYAGLLHAYAGDAHALDPGPIAAGYLGTFLCGVSALGVGLLASALTRSQVLAAVLSFTVLSLLLLCGMLADLYLRNESVRQVLLYMNLFNHMDEMGRGIVDTRRVVYHLSIGAATVFLAGRALRARPGDLPGGARAAAEAALCLLLLGGVNVVAAHHVHRADWTRAHLFALSEPTRGLLSDLARMDKTVGVTVFMYNSGDDRNDLYDDTHELLVRAERAAGGHLKVEFIDVDRDREQARLLGERFHIDRDDLREGVIVVESGGQQKFIQRADLGEYDMSAQETGAPPHLIAFRGEEALSSAILTVLERRTPELCFTTGHGESEYDSMTGGGLSDLNEALHRDNYKTRALPDLAAVDNPKGCDVVAIAGPERPFLPAEAAALSRYLDRGGRLLVMIGPMVDRGLSRFLDSGLEDLLRLRGIRLGQGVVIDPEHGVGPGMAFVVDEGYGDHPVSAPLLRHRTLWTLSRPVRALPTSPLPSGALWSSAELVTTTEKGFAETSLAALRDSKPAFTSGEDDKGPVPVAAAAGVKEVKEEDKGGRIVVLGSGQMGTNDTLALYNRDLILSAVSWLADVQRKVMIGPKRPAELRLVLTEDQLTRVFLVCLCGMPLMALLLGAGVFWIPEELMRPVLRRYGTLLCLAVLALGLLGYLLIDSRIVRRHPLPGTEPERLLPESMLGREAKSANLVQLVLHQRRPNETPVDSVLSLRRYEVAGKPEWWLDLPHVRADGSICEAMYQELITTTIRRRLAGARQGEAAAHYGLSDDRYHVRLMLRGGHELRLGDEAPGGLTYASRDGEPDVLLVEHHLDEVLSGDRAHFSLWALLAGPLEDARIHRLQLGDVVLEHRPSSWVMVTGRANAPHHTRARTDAVEEALRTLRTARPTRILGGEALRYREAPDEKPTPVMLKADKAEILYTGLPCPVAPAESYVARPDGARLCLGKEDLARLLPPAATLRELHLLPFPARQVRQLALSTAGGATTVVVRKSDGTFTVDGVPADTEAVRGYLADLATATGAPAPAREAGPAPADAGRLEIETEAGDRTVLRVAAGRVWRDDEEPLLVSPEVLDLLRQGPLRFRQRLLQSFDGYQARGLTVERTGWATEKAVRTTAVGTLGEGWQIRQPAAAPADPELMTRLLGLLSELRAERLVAAAAAPMHGLDRPRARFTVSVAAARDGTGGSQVVELGAQAARGEGCYVRAGGSPLVGLLAPPACADLARPLATSAVLLLDDARLRQARWERGGRVVVLSRRDRQYLLGDRPADAAALTAVLAGLHTLGSGEVAGYGPPPAGPPLLSITVEQDAPPQGATATALSRVAPEHQSLSVYVAPRGEGGARLWVAGRAVSYRVPDNVLRQVLQPVGL